MWNECSRRLVVHRLVFMCEDDRVLFATCVLGKFAKHDGIRRILPPKLIDNKSSLSWTLKNRRNSVEVITAWRDVDGSPEDIVRALDLAEGVALRRMAEIEKELTTVK
jgi:hypothetical protein